MQFNSLEFLLFCVLFYSVWSLLGDSLSRRWAVLTAASFLFYGWWDWRFLLLLVGTGLVDFYAAAAIVRWPSWKTLWLTASLVCNLGTLAVFKYLKFFTWNANTLFAAIGLEAQLPVVDLLLPVGISFYTFQSMSYTIDVYRGELKPTSSVLHFFAYLSMFPQLVAGPILRAADLLPQLETIRRVTEAQRWQGTQLIATGLFKKMVIADTVAVTVNQAFAANVQSGGCVFWWIAAAAFAVQIYCDFSGYSDIARGLAAWMGYDFAVNFDHPYSACSLRDFWGRWHISLSTWFRDYVYFPLGGSRCGDIRNHANLWITMIASGFWHGANWTFVTWGALHALLLSVERLTGWPDRLKRLPAGRLLATVCTLGLVLITWVFFRAENLGQATAIVGQMFNLPSFSLADLRLFNQRALAFTGLLLIGQLRFFFKWPDNLIHAGSPVGLALRRIQPVLTAFVLIACVYFRGPGSAFIYFQF